jgi:monoterpene epsilon-lactone hydrolase
MNLIRRLMTHAAPAVRLKRRLVGPTRPSWSEEFETIATVMREGADYSVLLPLSVQRQVIDPKRPDSDVVRATRIEPVDVDGIPGQWFTPPDARTDRVVVYFHGGGYSVGSVRSHRDLISRVAHGMGNPVLAVDYRLAPEHPFPAQIEDGIRTMKWLASRGFAANQVALSGESAGAGMVLSTMLKLRETGGAQPVAAVLISPWVDLEARSRSFHENRPYDFVTRRALEAYAKRFVKRHDRRNPLAAPIHADLHDLPPILIQVGEVETLRDEGIELARKIEAAHGHVELEVWTDMIHAFHVFAPLLPPARHAISRLTAFLRGRFELQARSAASASTSPVG